jgi:signal transduction protein with GAF and PtsI domain
MTRCSAARTQFSAPGDSAMRAVVAELRAMYPDIEEARGLHALLKQIVDRHEGASADYRALRRALDLCRRAFAAVEDRYCRDKLRIIEDFAAELFTHADHGKWQRETMSGGEFLRQQILGALELFDSRLYSLEAVRRSAARSSLKNLEPLRT